MSIPDISKRCNLLAQLKVGDRPCFSTCSPTNSIYSSLTRKYWYHENRNSGLLQIYLLLLDIKNIIPTYPPSEFDTLLQDIKMAINGCNTLALTYKDDDLISKQYQNLAHDFHSLLPSSTPTHTSATHESFKIHPIDRKYDLCKLSKYWKSSQF